MVKPNNMPAVEGGDV